MQIGRIPGFTRVLGQSQGFKGLPIKDTQLTDGTPVMQSAWLIEFEHIQALLDGAPLILTIMGTEHPPVKLEVDTSPRDDVVRADQIKSED